jgi:hypothetical protein
VPSAAGSSKVGDDPEVVEIGEHDIHGEFLCGFDFIPMPASGLFAGLKEQRKK